jgi:hypothetical protein
MLEKYKCTYFEVNRDRNSKDYGLLVQRTKKFPGFNDAVNFARLVSNTNINSVGRPIVEEINMTGNKD